MGTYSTQSDLEELMLDLGNRDDVLVVLDEAYCEFVRAHDFADSIELLKKYSNVVILRTMSKVFGLAGLRLGVVLARPAIISYLNRVRNPFNVNTLAQVGALAALGDIDYIFRSQNLVWSGLDHIYTELQRLGLPYFPSQANFILFDTLRDAQEVNRKLLDRGIILRPVGNYQMPTHLRMTVGLAAENSAALRALSEVLTEVAPLSINKSQSLAGNA